MALLNRPLDAITSADLDRLITTAAAESLYIDYKATTYGGAPADHREFLADISSFANTVGGDLIIGMTETDGIPTGFSPFPDYPDAELRRLDDMARSGLQPRVNLKTNAVASPIGGYVIVVRIPRSYNKPHRVIHSQSNRFWARSSASPKRYEPDVQELRQIFNETPVLAERIRAFRNTQLTAIAHQSGPIAIRGSCLLVLHLVPFSGFDLGIGLSVADLEAQWHLFPPLGRQYGTHRLVNFDGLVILSTGDDPSDPQPSYTQVFRNGAMEGAVQIEWPEGKLQASLIEKYLVPGIRNYLAALQRFDIASPVAILVSLLNVKGKIMESGVDGLHAHLGSLPIREEHLIFGELVVHDLPKDEQEFSHTLSPLVDQIWNIAGFSVRPSWLSRW